MKLKEIESKIEDKSLDIHLIFEVLNLIKLDVELNENLYLKKMHLNIFIVYIIFIINILKNKFYIKFLI